MSVNPLTWSLGAKFAGVGVTALIPAGTATTAIVTTSSTEPGVATYLRYNGPMGGDALLLQWNEQGF
jgi:hypothetical protein